MVLLPDVTQPRRTIEELCHERSIGRFAANRAGATPLVVPVNHSVDGTQAVAGADGRGYR